MAPCINFTVFLISRNTIYFGYKIYSKFIFLFQTYAVLRMLYAFFWVIPRSL